MGDDGSDLTRWNAARSLAGDILGAVSAEFADDFDGVGDTAAGTLDYDNLRRKHPDTEFPSEEALGTAAGVALCAVDPESLDIGMESAPTATTRADESTLAAADDRCATRGDGEGDEEGPSTRTRAVNLLARWVMSPHSDLGVGGAPRHRLNTWNEARHLSSLFFDVFAGDRDYEGATSEWPEIEFPSERDAMERVRAATETHDSRHEAIDEVARWLKNHDWLERDRREDTVVSMGGDERVESEVLRNTDQAELGGVGSDRDGRHTSASASGAGAGRRRTLSGPSASTASADHDGHRSGDGRWPTSENADANGAADGSEDAEADENDAGTPTGETGGDRTTRPEDGDTRESLLDF